MPIGLEDILINNASGFTIASARDNNVRGIYWVASTGERDLIGNASLSTSDLRSQYTICVVAGDIYIYTSSSIADVDWTNATNWIEIATGDLAALSASLAAEVTARTAGDSAINATVSTLTTTVNGNSISITSNAGAISNNASSISANASNISSNATDISANTGSISSNTSSISAATGDISQLQTDLASESSTRASQDATLLTAIQSNDSDISSLQSDVSTNSGNIQSNTTAISANTVDVSSNTAAIATNVTDIAAKVSADGSVTTHSDVSNAGSGAIITSAERTKLGTISSGAEVNVKSDWNAASGDAEILNKPSALDGVDGQDGADGADGLGWTSASYNSSTGVITFNSNDGLGFVTSDLRGADGTNGTNGTNGIDGDDGADGTNGTNGTNGLGFTGGTYNGSTGIITITSNDGLGFTTSDLRGADGANGTNGTNGIDGTNGTNGTNGADGDGFTGGNYNSSTGIVTFTSDDGLGFTTLDLRGADGVDGVDGVDGSDGNDGVDGTNGTNGTNGTDGADGDGFTGGSYNSTTGIVTFTSDDGLGFSTGDLRPGGAVANLTQHYLKTILPTIYLKNGASVVDFDYATPTKVLNLSQDTLVGSDISWANDKFTVSASGLYTFNVQGVFNTIGIDRAAPTAYLYVNGSKVEGAGHSYLRNLGTFDDSINFTRTLSLSANDYVELYIENTGNSTGTAVRCLELLVEAVSHEMTVTGVTTPNTLIGLTDTPSSMGTAGQVLAVNSGGTAVEFVNSSGGSSNQRTLTVPSSNGDWSGDVVTFGSLSGGGSFTQGKLYVWKTGAWYEAWASSTSASAGMLAIALEQNTTKMLTRGIVAFSSYSSFTTSNTLYVSANQSGSGRFMDSIPSTPASNSVIRICGYTINGLSGQIFFDPSKDFITLS